MAYQALYRQWRPRDFSHMVGQEAIVETLRHQVMTKRIAHAYLFCGSRGTGKTSTAKILARAINCEDPREGDPCGACEACRRLEAQESLDVMEIDAASNNGVDNVRDLRDAVQYPPQLGRYKVFIIDEVHMLSASAFNALLKTLEEPPEYVVFILATTEPQKLPATILSRCQRYDFGRISASLIQGRLKEAADGAGLKTTPGALMMIARAAEGGMRDALSILDMCMSYGETVTEQLVHSVLGTSDRAFLFRFSDALAGQNAAEVIRLIDELMRGGRDPLVFAKDVSAHLRALLMARAVGKEICDVLELTEEDAADYLRESERFAPSRLMDMLDQFMRLETELRYASNGRIALETAGLKCCLRTEAVDTLSLNDRLTELDNRLTHLSEQVASGTVAVPVRQQAAKENKAPEAGTGGGKKEKAAPAAAMAPSGRGSDEIWREAMRALQKTEPGVEGQLKQGTFLGSEDGVTYRWRARPGYEIMAQILNMPRQHGQVEAALSAAAGVPCRFEALDTASEIKKAADSADERYVEGLSSVFGKEAVTVVEKLT